MKYKIMNSLFSPRMNCSLFLFPFISPSLSSDLLFSCINAALSWLFVNLSLLYPAEAGIPLKQVQEWIIQEPQLRIQICPVNVIEGWWQVGLIRKQNS